MPIKFRDVPEEWKYPTGPYRQAPAEYGGEWWQVNPFTTDEPWLTEAATKDYPPGFLETFGRRPVLSDYRGSPNPRALHQADVARWDQDLRFFQKAGWPDWPQITPALIDEVTRIFQAWGMGTPRPYLGRYDWRVRFPGSMIRNFESSVFGVISYPHMDIARYQADLLRDYNIVPSPRHPFVPAHLWPADEEVVAVTERTAAAPKPPAKSKPAKKR